MPIILKSRNNVQTGHNNNDNGQTDWDINTATQLHSNSTMAYCKRKLQAKAKCDDIRCPYSLHISFFEGFIAYINTFTCHQIPITVVGKYIYVCVLRARNFKEQKYWIYAYKFSLSSQKVYFYALHKQKQNMVCVWNKFIREARPSTVHIALALDMVSS